MTAPTPTEDGRQAIGPVRVVANHRCQYSVWPAGRELPAGWTDVGVGGSTEDCLAHIERVWTDAQPREPKEMSS